MYYYHFIADTPFIGTEQHYFLEFLTPLSQAGIDDQCEEYKIENAESYSYMVTDWGEECSEEEMDDYYGNCSCYCEQITDPDKWEELQEEYA